ncbi:hypothetical protein QFC21_005900 [Naganishia friedmannii]|uniref:Uncharacterized protein n=1 Tax=Naganishia friedmannii TaxID=89922 RepID=A0ACC2V843_9TREE|nr:hypothetical protein QFC21_005900 [Naganishia friedmannii]
MSTLSTQRSRKYPHDQTLPKQDGIRLPYDVISLVADVLAEEDGLLETLAALNVTSRAVHLATLPILYRRLEIREDDNFRYVVGFELPKGWAYTKYLIVWDAPLAALKMLDRCVRIHNRQPLGRIDITTIFPRLVCMCVSGIQHKTIPREITNRLEVFRPMSLDVIHHLYDAEGDIQDTNDPCYHKYQCVYTFLPDLDEILIRKGARLLASNVKECSHAIDSWTRGRYGEPPGALRIRIEDERLDPGMETTMRIVLDLLTYSTRPARRPRLLEKSRKRGLVLTCYPPIFEAFNRSYGDNEPMLFVLHVILLGEEGSISSSDIFRYLSALAAIYARHWTHVDPEEWSWPFVWVHADIELPERYTAVEGAQRGALAGHLEVGQMSERHLAPVDGRNMTNGFHSHVLEGWTYGPGELLEDGDFVGPIGNYACVEASSVAVSDLVEFQEHDDDTDDDFAEDDEKYDDIFGF